MFRNKLRVSAEIYHCHPDDLTPEQEFRLLDYMALYVWDDQNRKA